MAKIITFGEIMARMAPSGVLRLRQVLPRLVSLLDRGVFRQLFHKTSPDSEFFNEQPYCF